MPGQYEALGQANRAEVEALTNYLVHAFESYYNDPTRAEPLTYLDSIMAVHNFHKAILLDLWERTQPEERPALFFKMAADTFADAMRRAAEERSAILPT